MSAFLHVEVLFEMEKASDDILTVLGYNLYSSRRLFDQVDSPGEGHPPLNTAVACRAYVFLSRDAVIAV